VVPRAGLDDVEKILDLTGIRTPTPRSSSRYTIYVIKIHTKILPTINLSDIISRPHTTAIFVLFCFTYKQYIIRNLEGCVLSTFIKSSMLSDLMVHRLSLSR
jgi:hypothetical protein